VTAGKPEQKVILCGDDGADQIITHEGAMTDREFDLWAEGIAKGAVAAARMLGRPDTFMDDPIMDPLA